MNSKYYIGSIELPGPEIDWGSTVLACNLLLRQGNRIEFGHAKLQNDKIILPFVSKGSLENDIRDIFDEGEVTCLPLKVCLSDKKALRAAARVNSIDPKNHTVARDDIMLKSAKNPLNAYIGLERQIETIKSIAMIAEAYGRQAVDLLHMMFVGPPGVGKTTVAHALLEEYDRAGVTSGKGVFVNASANDLVSQYVGETPRLVKSIFDKAEGGILFIDEAYRLSRQAPASDGSSHGQEAIDAINQLMEEQREQVIVILAGYPNEMRDFVRHNPGLTGRIGFEVEFDEYSPDQLLSIFKKMAQERKFEVDEAALNILEDKMPSIMALEDFASARTMRKILDHAVVKKANSLLDHVIRAEEVASALEDKDFRLASKQPIGFAL